MELYSSRHSDLLRLRKWLDYELSSSALLFFSWLWGFLLLGAVLAAVVFIPFMIKVLFQEKKYGWLIYFFLIVVVPAVIIYSINIDFLYKVLFTSYVPLALFLFYCFTLKLAVRTWVTEKNFRIGNIKEIKTDDIFKNYKF